MEGRIRRNRIRREPWKPRDAGVRRAVQRGHSGLRRDPLSTTGLPPLNPRNVGPGGTLLSAAEWTGGRAADPGAAPPPPATPDLRTLTSTALESRAGTGGILPALRTVSGRYAGAAVEATPGSPAAARGESGRLLPPLQPARADAPAMVTTALRHAGFPKSSAAAVGRCFAAWDLHCDGYLQPPEALGFLRDLHSIAGVVPPPDWELRDEVSRLAPPPAGLSAQACVQIFTVIAASAPSPAHAQRAHKWWERDPTDVKRWQQVARSLVRQHGSLRAAFANMNTSAREGDASLDHDEFRRGMQAAGISNTDVDQLLKELDRDRSGTVDLREFMRLVGDPRRQSQNMDGTWRGMASLASPRPGGRRGSASPGGGGGGGWAAGDDSAVAERALAQLGCGDAGGGGGGAGRCAAWLRERCQSALAKRRGARGGSADGFIRGACERLRRKGHDELATPYDLAAVCAAPDALEALGLSERTAARLRAAVDARTPCLHPSLFPFAAALADGDDGASPPRARAPPPPDACAMGAVSLLAAAAALDARARPPPFAPRRRSSVAASPCVPGDGPRSRRRSSPPPAVPGRRGSAAGSRRGSAGSVGTAPLRTPRRVSLVEQPVD